MDNDGVDEEVQAGTPPREAADEEEEKTLDQPEVQGDIDAQEVDGNIDVQEGGGNIDLREVFGDIDNPKAENAEVADDESGLELADIDDSAREMMREMGRLRDTDD